MGTTPNGLPYPEGTDLVMEGDDAIKALATALKISTGGGAVPAGSSVRYVTMTFPAGLYATAPWLAISVTNPFMNAGIQNLTASGFTAACLWRDSAGNTSDTPSGHIVRFVAARIGA